MAKVFPFRPYRYAASAGPLEDLVTQPYDKISPQMQARYLALNPHNLVRIILGERFPTDSETDNVYTRAAASFEDWVARKILQQDDEPAFYAYFQKFQAPDEAQVLVRKGFIGLGAVEDYAEGTVHRHEKTLSGPKKDRMEVLAHTRAHFGQIFMLYPDPQGAIDQILDTAASQPPAAQVTDEYGVLHTLWRIADPAVVNQIQERMADKKLVIADGHHRYETAVAFRASHPDWEDARKVMMTFVNMHAPGLRILATHRVLAHFDSLDQSELLANLQERFRVTSLPSLDSLRGAFAEPHSGLVRMGVYFASGDLYLLERPRAAGDLDVAVLHDEILAQCLGIGEEAVREQKFLRYLRGMDSAIQEVRERGGQVAFLLEPTSVEQVAHISFSGGVMPQKSTDFYPKLLSGLTIYRLEK